MNGKNLILLAAVLLVAAVWPRPSRADTIDLTLVQATQTVVQGTTVVGFDATVSNPTAVTEFLNSDGSTTNSALVTVDDSPFTGLSSVWPLTLAPSGQSGDSFGPALLFNLDLPANLAPGTYTGSFSILGGTDSATFDDIADVNFTVEVTSAVVTPEPAMLLLLGSGLAGLGLLRNRKKAAL